MTAVAAARHGMKTALLEPRHHVGGMANGAGYRAPIRGPRGRGWLALEFYYRVGERYERSVTRTPSPGSMNPRWASR
jgi:glycine/D-amino acid oxidase-like deaminating enzyme